MGMQLLDGTGRGNRARIDANNRLHTNSVAESIQADISLRKGEAYQVIGETALAAATKNVLFVNNISSSFMWVTYIRIQIVGAAGGTTGAATYFEMTKEETYGSGGTAVTPTNMNFSSGNTAEVNAYNDNPTLAGTAVVFERWYPGSANDRNTYNKEGALLLGNNDGLGFRITTDHTSGLAHVRLSFIMVDPSERN
jgi:hypothetical protein